MPETVDTITVSPIEAYDDTCEFCFKEKASHWVDYSNGTSSASVASCRHCILLNPVYRAALVRSEI